MRRVEKKDFEVLFKWRNDEDVIKNSREGKGKNLEEFTKWFESEMNNKFSYMFILENKNEYIGQINFEIVKGESVINYSVDKNFRNRGFGKELVKYIEEFIYDNLEEVKKIAAYINTSNTSSIKIFESLGYTREIDGKYFVKLVK
ncbi:GNAT family N-acetyltransferase [Clostridium gasigenes]|uniref:GNAT family N-acetyltransferase n=1 Tax=Clostridium gasigenes TaxID=94869 RepID=UPI001C0DEC9F|nr:GNAT family N-acetyltransferase [Clostridium gasigenes]MBU3131228.1 GNAT family N-acetyltransferase [Clostridium gasigenes]